MASPGLTDFKIPLQRVLGERLPLHPELLRSYSTVQAVVDSLTNWVEKSGFACLALCGSRLLFFLFSKILYYTQSYFVQSI